MSEINIGVLVKGLVNALTPEPWMDSALCAQTDPDAFFPQKGATVQAQEAKKVCQRCPVQAECLEYAVENGFRFGLWGGVAERARQKMIADRRAEQRKGKAA